MMRLACAIAVAALAFAPACGKKKDKDKPAPAAAKVDTTPKPPEPKPEPPKPDPELIARGAYMANVAGCVSCHTAIGPTGPDTGNPYAGGLEVTEEFGPTQFTWRSANITPDVDTGIGAWKDEEIIAAFRDGVRPDGSRLVPIMPYAFYSAMSDDDAKALVAYLRSLKPVTRKVERLPLPEMFAKMPAPPKATGAAWPAEKRGEYLATVMHCAMCHTPMTPQGPDVKRAFAGGFPMKIPPQFKAVGTGANFSANITSDKETGIGKWTEQQVADAIKQMKRPDPKRDMIGFPMAMYQMSWSQLTDEDVMAVARFIKSIPPIRNKVQASTFKPGPAFEAMRAAHHGGPPPADKAPEDKAPADKAPADKAPADKAPADKAPVEDKTVPK